MADITITAANVLARAGAIIEQQTLFETVTQGQLCYQASANSNWGLADSNGATADIAGNTGLGIAVTAGAAGQSVLMFRAGTIKIGGTVAPGQNYGGSNTAGGIAPVADVAITGYQNYVGAGLNTTDIETPDGGMYCSGIAKSV